MIALPLRFKIAILSAACATVTIVMAMLGVRAYLRFDLLQIIDARMDREARDVFRGIEAAATSEEVVASLKHNDALTTLGVINRLVELTERDGRLIYRSAMLGDRKLESNSNAHFETIIEGRSFLVGTYYHKFTTLRLAYPLAHFNRVMRRIDTALWVAIPTVFLLSLGGGFLIASRALRPLKEIMHSAEYISAQNLNHRIPVPAVRDEIHTLSLVLNDTFSRLQKSYLQAVHFASDASHQLKTPVTVMRSAIEHLLQQPGLTPEQSAELSELLQQTRRLSSLADGLLLLARADAGRLSLEIKPVDVAPLIEGCLEDAEVLAHGRGLPLTIERDVPRRLPALIDTRRLEQVLLNLLENAVKYNRPGGTIIVTASAGSKSTSIHIFSTTTPIPAERREHIFDRFVRGEADETRAGHGLGLSIARELCRAQGGDLELLRSDADGTEFHIRLSAPPRGSEIIRPQKQLSLASAK